MKKIAVITGSRADYDLLYNIIFFIKHSKKLKLQLYVTGAHLKKKIWIKHKSNYTRWF